MADNTQDNNFRCGMVSIVGRPNVGKSTLLNNIVKEKIAIVSKIPQTTRTQIRGIYNDQRGQIIFIDTPGLHFAKDRLDKFMNESSKMTMDDTDCIIYLVDVKRRTGEEEQRMVDQLKNVSCPIIMGLNKVDLGDDYIPDYIDLWEKAKGKTVNEMEKFTLLPMSGLKGTHIDKLIDILFPVSPALYPSDTVTDTPQKMVIADIIREKLFMRMREEIPHSIGVAIEQMQPRKKKTVFIQALIYVEREPHKEMVIGKNGKNLKEVGTLAREELESLLDSKVFLELRVKTQKNWRDNASVLEELGYGHF